MELTCVVAHQLFDLMDVVLGLYNWKPLDRNPVTVERNHKLRQVWVLVFSKLMGILENYYLPPAAEGHGREIIKRLPSVCSSRFCINLNISFIYEDIFTKFAGNVYGYKTCL